MSGRNLFGLALAAALGGMLLPHEHVREIREKVRKPKIRSADPAKKAARKRQRKARRATREAGHG